MVAHSSGSHRKMPRLPVLPEVDATRWRPLKSSSPPLRVAKWASTSASRTVDHLLGQDRQVAERAVGDALVKAPVEGRAGIGVPAQAMQRPVLMRFELRTRPAVPLAQPVP